MEKKHSFVLARYEYSVVDFSHVSGAFVRKPLVCLIVSCWRTKRSTNGLLCLTEPQVPIRGALKPDVLS